MTTVGRQKHQPKRLPFSQSPDFAKEMHICSSLCGLYITIHPMQMWIPAWDMHENLFVSLKVFVLGQEQYNSQRIPGPCSCTGEVGLCWKHEMLMPQTEKQQNIRHTCCFGVGLYHLLPFLLWHNSSSSEMVSYSCPDCHSSYTSCSHFCPYFNR